MDLEEFHKQLSAAPLSFRRNLRNYLQHPTERNVCFITGYVVALKDMCLFKTDDAASYWMALIGRVEGNTALGCSLIAAMDNPPAGGTQAAEIEALRAGVERLNRILGRIVEGDGDSTTTIRAGTDAFAAAREYLLGAPLKESIMNWIRVSNRKPTVDDADEAGHVWVYDKVFADVSSVHFYQVYSPYYTHWMPKEKRPAPSAPKGEHQ